MTIKPLFMGFAVLALLLVGCTQKETQQLDIKGDLEVYVTAYSQWGDKNNDKANFEVKLEGSIPELVVQTDTSGKVLFQSVPVGTYVLTVSKNGYGKKIVQNFQFIGSDKPKKTTVGITQTSTTVLTDVSALYQKDTITVSGKYTNTAINSAYPRVYIAAYWDTTANVSFKKYYNETLLTILATTDKPNVNKTFQFKVMRPWYSDKKIIYFILYGGNRSNLNYDYETRTYYNSSLGCSSDIIKVVIP